jgi:hypothetical protein
MTNVCRSRDPEEPAERSEFGWGRGLRPRGYENLPPSEGGQYRGTCEPVAITPSPDLSVRTVGITSRRGRRPDSSPNGYPGDKIAD